MWNHFEESGEAILGRLAELLGVTAEALESSIGSNWTSTSATPNLIIRGDDMGVLFSTMKTMMKNRESNKHTQTSEYWSNIQIEFMLER